MSLSKRQKTNLKRVLKDYRGQFLQIEDVIALCNKTRRKKNHIQNIDLVREYIIAKIIKESYRNILERSWSYENDYVAYDPPRYYRTLF
jgi:hypothetical protein